MKYYEFLYLVYTAGKPTGFWLKNIKDGAFMQQMEECIERKYIMFIGKAENGEDQYGITDLGKKIINVT